MRIIDNNAAAKIDHPQLHEHTPSISLYISLKIRLTITTHQPPAQIDDDSSLFSLTERSSPILPGLVPTKGGEHIISIGSSGAAASIGAFQFHPTTPLRNTLKLRPIIVAIIPLLLFGDCSSTRFHLLFLLVFPGKLLNQGIKFIALRFNDNTMCLFGQLLLIGFTKLSLGLGQLGAHSFEFQVLIFGENFHARLAFEDLIHFGRVHPTNLEHFFPRFGISERIGFAR
mmetsp:Transcript_21890/g.33434  ORF Transcript_21890/g.33434 Transcript_21890/m.33434 type:complete len:228 (-) Transcript_21890:206-889(-)